MMDQLYAMLENLAWDLATDKLSPIAAADRLRFEVLPNLRPGAGEPTVVLVPEPPTTPEPFPTQPAETDLFPAEPGRRKAKGKRATPRKPRCKVTTQMIDAVLYHVHRNPRISSQEVGDMVGCSDTTAHTIRHGGYDRNTARPIASRKAKPTGMGEG